MAERKILKDRACVTCVPEHTMHCSAAELAAHAEMERHRQAKVWAEEQAARKGRELVQAAPQDEEVAHA